MIQYIKKLNSLIIQKDYWVYELASLFLLFYSDIIINEGDLDVEGTLRAILNKI